METELNKIICGIDPGVNTGFAVFNPFSKTMELYTLKLHKAFDKIRELKPRIKHVVIENPNLWVFFKDQKQAAAKLQGAGSVKRDFSAWMDFLKDEGILVKTTKPDKHRNAIAYNTELFERITKYDKRSSEHARVAAMLIYN